MNLVTKIEKAPLVTVIQSELPKGWVIKKVGILNRLDNFLKQDTLNTDKVLITQWNLIKPSTRPHVIVVRKPAPAPAPVTFHMTAVANELTREEYHKSGWSDELLIEKGYMIKTSVEDWIPEPGDYYEYIKYDKISSKYIKCSAVWEFKSLQSNFVDLSRLRNANVYKPECEKITKICKILNEEI